MFDIVLWMENIMAKDDYHVIVYQILAYLYTCLKTDEAVDPALLQHDSKMMDINRNYWVYIIENLQEQGYIRGAELSFAMGHVLVNADLSACQITPAGIEYLCDNSTLKKAYRFLKEIKGIVPFDLI